MKRFQFTLERVLAWRRVQERAEEVKLETLLGELEGIERQRLGLDAELQAAELTVYSAASVEAGQLVALDAFRVHTKQRAFELRMRRDECERRVARQQSSLIEARRAAELVEKLKERKLTEWTKKSDRETETLASELYLARLVSETRRADRGAARLPRSRR